MVIMSWHRCDMLITMAWGIVWPSVALLLVVLRLPFHGFNQIGHYLCDVKPLLKLVCKDICAVNTLMIANSGMVVVVVFLVLVASYILYKLRTRSSAGPHKALPTCSSHVVVVVLFFMPCIYVYVLPAGSENKDKETSVTTPMLNPLICTLRNVEMILAMMKVWSQMAHSEFK
ncbi:Olfactory receptor 4C11 [Manis javanica]|nr:Olfactory receptor 4C11 [Manis javanica]